MKIYTLLKIGSIGLPLLWCYPQPHSVKGIRFFCREMQRKLHLMPLPPASMGYLLHQSDEGDGAELISKLGSLYIQSPLFLFAHFLLSLLIYPSILPG